MLAQLMSELVRHQHPMKVHPEVTVAEACRQVGECRIAAVLVADADNPLLGNPAGRDAVRVLTRECAATDLIRLTQDGRLRQVPVVDHRVVVGVVYWGDFRISEHDQVETKINFCELT